MRSERQALADIAKVVTSETWYGQTSRITDILANVQPEPAPVGGTIDIEKTRKALREFVQFPFGTETRILTAIAACVVPAPVGGVIDRDTLMRTLIEFPWLGRAADVYRIADRILALVRPIEGDVVLTRVEASITADWYDYIVDQGGDVPKPEAELALRLRAEASS